MTQQIHDAPDQVSTRPLNSRKAKPSKDELRAQLQDLQSQVTEIELAEIQEQETARTNAEREYNELLAGAATYRQKATQAISPAKKEQFETQMFQCLDAADVMREQFPFLVAAEPEPQPEKKPMVRA